MNEGGFLALGLISLATTNLGGGGAIMTYSVTTYVLNFAHPITDEQAEQLKKLLGTEIEVVDVPTQLDLFQSLQPQIERLLDQVGWSSSDWQTFSFVVNPPGLAAATAVVLAEIHGRAGYFPPVIVLRRVPDSTPPRFEVGELVNLQEVRDSARRNRF